MHDDRTRVLLENGNSRFALEWCDRSGRLADRLVRFLAPSFEVAREPQPPDFSIVFKPYADLPDAWTSQAIGRRTIRRSTADMFNLIVDVVIDEPNRIVVNDSAKRTAYDVDREERTITAYVSDTSFIHLIEMIRYTVLILEEDRGSTLLHASAAVRDGEAVLVLGHKGAGKTTTLLRLLLRETYDYISGDKVLLNEGSEGVTVRSWPDYPHVGIGSLRPYPAFAEACGVTFVWTDGRPKDDGHKELIEPHRFRSALPGTHQRSCGKVRALLFPDIASRTCGLERLDAGARSLDDLRVNVEFPFEFTPGRWHGLFDQIARTARATDDRLLRSLVDVPWYAVKGYVSTPLSEKLS